MRISSSILAAAVVALLPASCSCPRPPYPCGDVGSVCHPCPAPSDPPIYVVREYPVDADCENSKPAKVTPMGTSISVVPQYVLPVIPRCQEGLYSCWSTTTEMVLEFLTGGLIEQCRQSNQAFDHAYCCGPNGVLIVNSACDSPWYPEFEKWGYDYDYRLEYPLNANEVTAHIFSAGQPFAFSWARNPTPPANPTGVGTVPGTGETQADQITHMLLAIGYGVDVQTKEQALVIIDPHPFIRSDAAIVPHHEYDGSDQSYTHWEDYVRFRPLQ